MRRSTRPLSAVLLAATCAVLAPAHPLAAQPLRFELFGALSASWVFDAMPTPAASTSTSFDLADIVITTPTGPTTRTLVFFTADEGGGACALTPDDLDCDFEVVDVFGEQLFFGSTDAPVFAPTGNDVLLEDGFGDEVRLRISAVPEPSMLLLLAAGGAGLVLRRRKRALS